jgi:hypothetical protein
LQKCFLGCSKSSNRSEQFDHYMDVKDKFPKDLEKVFIQNKICGKGGMAMKKNNFNRVVDESVIT